MKTVHFELFLDQVVQAQIWPNLELEFGLKFGWIRFQLGYLFSQKHNKSYYLGLEQFWARFLALIQFTAFLEAAHCAALEDIWVCFINQSASPLKIFLRTKPRFEMMYSNTL